jgi:hypothetical protein
MRVNVGGISRLYMDGGDGMDGREWQLCDGFTLSQGGFMRGFFIFYFFHLPLDKPAN